MNRSFVAMAAAAAAAAAQAAEVVPPQNVVSLSATASVEVPQDVLSIAFGTTRDGQDAATVQAALKQALDAALNEARKVARPQQLEVRTGNFSLYPRYASKGGISGWQGSAELVVEGRDMAGIAQLSGRITTLAISRVGYGLSREAREKVEDDVAAQAIATFRAKAGQVSKQFGFDSYSIREVSVDTGGAPMPKEMMGRVSSMRASADAPLPVEAGRSEVTATVSGSIQMTR